MLALNRISTFAVLDLETTGLPDYNFNKSKITELAIYGFAAEDVRNATTCKIPRINHKLSLLFNPRMMIHPEAEKITGLSNFMLEHESFFDENAAYMIVNFLKHLRQPVCLVAHNGDKFDFPLFKQEIDKHKVELPSDLVCIDTLVAIKELDRLADEADNEVVCDSQEIENTFPLPNVEDFEPISILKSEDEEKEPSDWQKFNETTPKRPPNSLSVKRKLKRKIDVEEKTPQPQEKIKSRRELFNMPTQLLTGSPKKCLPYKLESIYTRVFGEAPGVAHHAGADVEVLQTVMLHYGRSFVEYAEKNAKSFTEVKKVGER